MEDQIFRWEKNNVQFSSKVRKSFATESSSKSTREKGESERKSEKLLYEHSTKFPRSIKILEVTERERIDCMRYGTRSSLSIKYWIKSLHMHIYDRNEYDTCLCNLGYYFSNLLCQSRWLSNLASKSVKNMSNVSKLSHECDGASSMIFTNDQSFKIPSKLERRPKNLLIISTILDS